MPQEKPLILWDNVLTIPGSSLTATNTATGYDVANVRDLRPYTAWKAADTTTPMYVSFDAGSGKITNGDFETGDTSGWTLYVDTGAGASASFAASGTSPYEGSYKCAVTITAGGPNSTRIQMHQGSKPITNGKKQYVKFAARCAAGTRNIETVIQKDASPYTGYTAEGTQTIGITTSWQVFDIVWTANTTAQDARLVFFLGGNDTDVDIDIVCWWEEGAVPLADSLAILGHNFDTAGCASIGLHSSDTAHATNADAFTPFKPTADGTLVKTFDGVTTPHRYWRWYSTGHSAAPQMAVLMLGQRLQMERFMLSGYDPSAEVIKAHTERGGTGHPLGTAIDYISYDLTARWDRLTDAWVRNTFKPVWDAHLSQLKPFFWVWDPGSHPDEVRYVKVPDSFKLSTPYNPVRRSLTLRMEGVKE